MKRKIELLAPGGDIDSIKAAIAAGANAIYCGLNKFNARNRAANINFEELQGTLQLAHKHNCKVYLTLNIIIVESEIPALFGLLNKLINTNIDGVIVQDLGMLYLLTNYFSDFNIHASTQLTTHNEGQIKFLNRLKIIQVNLARELNIHEIKTLSSVGQKHNIKTEIFVHGSYCISFSGLCYLSSVQGANSGNRGRCSQPCRDQYITTPQGKNFPLNLKDNSAYLNLKKLSAAGVASVKIEGRIKKSHYVYTVTEVWRKQLDRLYNQKKLHTEDNNLYKIFNRDFSNSFLTGDINKELFIDNPRDHSAIHLAKTLGGPTDENIEKAKKENHAERTKIIAAVKSKIKQLSIAKPPISISFSGDIDSLLTIVVKTPENSFVIYSESKLVRKGTHALDYKMLLSRFKSINDTEYYITRLDITKLGNDLLIPFKELTAIKNKILFKLNGSKKTVAPVTVPVLKKNHSAHIKPTLSVLISSLTDMRFCKTSNADIYFQLPDCFKDKSSELLEFFKNNKKLIPWFPSILIGENYIAAVDFLIKLQPERIVTNNTGIAFEAYENKLAWIAGPYLNIVNSYSLLCLKDNFNCCGSFISNEISKLQIKGIKKPDDFILFYSIYHPIELMTSRQCLFHQVTGCEKNKLDDSCILECKRSASITNLQNCSFIIEKSKRNYHRIYNEVNYLNTDIVVDIPNLFSGFFIDLREINTATKINLNKGELICLFEDHLNGNVDAAQQLKNIIVPSTHSQYHKGI